ncbi:MAG TPA: IS200/IS605 family transposase [Pirellulales bacterium]|jgi:REP element-mobilizing transposase RayT|nr:IS200/IS605 family transposase [Pirellulales bacterium]
MASHVFHEIYLHLNWHAKGDRPLLTPKVEPLVHNFIRTRCRQTKGVYFHGVNGTSTHVHLAVNIEPSVSISELVKDLKGAPSHEINKEAGRAVLQWQRGYGVVSFGKQQLAWVLEYIANQKEHHAKGTARRRLEQTGEDD